MLYKPHELIVKNVSGNYICHAVFTSQEEQMKPESHNRLLFVAILTVLCI